MTEAAALSIIIPCGRLVSPLRRCLDSLAPQLSEITTEVIVPYSCPDDSLQDLTTTYPDVRFLKSFGKATLPGLIGAGISDARGRIVAVLGPTCEVGSQWLSATLDAHENTTAPVIGGAVELTRASSLTDWAAYFVDYGQFMLPLKAGYAKEVPGNNLSFKRRVAGDTSKFRESGFWKAFWCRKLQKEGMQFVLTPTIIVFLHKSVRLRPYLVRRFQNGRCFAGMRNVEISLPRRVAYTFGSLLLPLIFFARILSSVIPKRRHVTQFILCLPVIGFAVTAWSCGEFCGYLFGSGESCFVQPTQE